jgi:hypothetical protein
VVDDEDITVRALPIDVATPPDELVEPSP